MEGSKIIEAEKVLGLPPPPSLTVAVAVSGKRKSKQLVKWALEKFVPEGNAAFKLLHVRPRIISVPTPMGNFIPISQVREDVAEAYKKEMEWQASRKILPCKDICTHRQVQADVVVIESDDVAKALADDIAQSRISKLVLGASSGGMFSRKLKGDNLSSRISACTPSFCTVYIISRGKLSSIRPSDSETNASVKDKGSVTCSSTSSSSSQTLSYKTECAEFFSVPSSSHLQSAPLPVQQFQALSAINKGLVPARTSSMEIHLSKCQSLDIDEKPDTVSSCSGHSEVGHPISRSSSCKSLLADNQSWISDQASTSDVTDYSSFGNQVHINFELEKLKIELRHFRGMYAVAQTEAIDASRKWNNLNKRRLEEATKLKEISYREELAREVASQEKERCEAVVREADYIKKCTEREASQRLGAEIKAMRDAKEKEKLENALAGPVHWYQKFTWEEIVSATSSFSENLKIGMGAHGTVYKCSLHHTTGAVKVLHSKENQNTKQFLQEVWNVPKLQTFLSEYSPLFF
uniref:RING-type E3 ubiquitin transferase n=1 Tax=Rhizophora mucronata TaxID=61149 RepID=A0A2P2LNW5_RHIMU